MIMEMTYEYLHTLRNRMMALRAKIEENPKAGELQPVYGHDMYQEEIRCMGLRMIRDGLNHEGENLILDFVREHYPESIETERNWIGKMMRYLNLITDALIDNLLAEGYIGLRSNTDLPYENALFYPIRTLTGDNSLYHRLNIQTLVPLDGLQGSAKFEGWLYFPSGSAFSSQK